MIKAKYFIRALPDWLIVCDDILKKYYPIIYPQQVIGNPDAKEHVNVLFL